MVATPNTATAANIFQPVPRSMGRVAKVSAIIAAPTAGALRNRPRPIGPTCRMSRANTGSSAVAPPSSTANRSSEIAPKTTGRARKKRTPSATRANLPASAPTGFVTRRPPSVAMSAPDARNPITQTL